MDSMLFLLVLLIIPTLTYSYFFFIRKLFSISKTEYAIRCAIYILLISVIYCFFRTDIGVEELLLLSFCFIIILYLPYKKNDVLKKLLLITIICIIYSIFTYGQAHIHSDTASASLLVQNIFKEKNIFPKAWNYANGEFWVLNQWPENSITTLLFSNKSFARSCGSFISVISTIIIIIIFSKKYLSSDSYLISIPVIFTCLVGSSSEFSGEGIPLSLDMLLYQAAYVRTLSLLLLFVLLLGKILFNKTNKQLMFLMGLFSLVLAISGIRTFVEFIIPAVLSIAIYYLVSNNSTTDKKKIVKKYLIISAIIVFSSLIGYGIHKWLSLSRNTGLGVRGSAIFSDSIQSLFNNIYMILVYILDCFGFYPNVNVFSIKGVINIILIIACLLFMYVLPILQIKEYKNTNRQSLFFSIYVFVHNIILIIAIILLSKKESYYLLTSIFLSIVLSSRYIYEKVSSRKQYIKNIFIIMFSVCITITNINILLYSVGWRDTLSKKKEVAKSIVDNGVSKIYANYWEGYPLEVYSDHKFKAGSIDIKVNVDTGTNIPIANQNPWLNDQTVFDVEEGIKTACVIQDYEYNVYGLNDKYIIQLFGDYKKAIDINGYRIYIFDYDIISKTGNGLLDSTIEPHEFMFVTEDGGEIGNEEILLYPKGCTYGPYIQMDKGEYDLYIYGYNLDNCQFGVNSFTANQNITCSKISGDENSLNYHLSLSDITGNIEFILYNDSSENNAYYYKVEVIKNKTPLIQKLLNQ